MRKIQEFNDKMITHQDDINAFSKLIEELTDDSNNTKT